MLGGEFGGRPVRKSNRSGVVSKMEVVISVYEKIRSWS